MAAAKPGYSFLKVRDDFDSPDEFVWTETFLHFFFLSPRESLKTMA